MTLIVEDGTGLATAESYVSVADADAYHTKMGTAAASWGDLTTAVKEAALRRATQFIDTRYRFQGVVNSGTQALLWPRVGVWLHGYYVEATTIPQRLKDACAELAMRAAAGDLLPDADEGGEVSAESISIGPISESKTYVGSKSSVKDYPVVRSLLTPMLQTGGLVERG